MNIPEILLQALREIWWLLCAAAVGALIVVLERLALSRCRTFFNRTGSFPELAPFTKDDQQRLLREASREAFSVLSFVPVLVLLTLWWVGAVVAWTLANVAALPAWVAAVLGSLFIGLGGWLGRRLEAHRVRPFLKKVIDGQNGKSVA
ncbi:MAG: hypothetical protein ACOYXY_03270 [Thermodesulfobacteriota bacterium]